MLAAVARVLISALTAAVLLLAFPIARAQTLSSSATPPPSGKTLINLTAKAMLAQGSAHHTYVVHSKSAQFGTLTLTGSGDILFAQNRTRDRYTTTLRMNTGGHVTTQRQLTESIQVGKRTATRTDGKAWKCSSTAASPTTFNPRHPTSSYKSLTTLGPGAVSGVPTWQVLGKQREEDETDVFDIAQRGSLLLQVNATLMDRSSSSPSTLTLNETYTTYGEKTTIELPALCKALVEEIRGG